MFKCNRFHTTIKSTVVFKREKSGIEMNQILERAFQKKQRQEKGLKKGKIRKKQGDGYFFTVASICREAVVGKN